MLLAQCGGRVGGSRLRIRLLKPGSAMVDLVHSWLLFSVCVYESLRPSGVGFGFEAFEQVRVVVLERRTLGADARDEHEVVPRRRATRGPFQGVAVPPRILRGHDLAVPIGTV